MKQFSYVLTRTVAPHARPMGSLIKEASRFSSSVNLCSGTASAALRRVSDLLSLKMDKGSRITVTVEGRDEEAAVAAIQNYVVANL